MSRYYSYLVFKVKVFVVYLDINNNWIQKKIAHLFNPSKCINLGEERRIYNSGNLFFI